MDRILRDRNFFKRGGGCIIGLIKNTKEPKALIPELSTLQLKIILNYIHK